jgi:phospholipid/cholesterol/gamma-HCH transport system substrate-binding protein
METRANYLAVAAFVVAILACTAGAAILLLNLHPFPDTRAFYEIDFHGSVVGLKVEAPVYLAGIPIGNVRKVQLDPEDPTVVHLTIEVRKDAPVRSDSVASLDVSLVFGDASISITGGSEQAAPLPVLPNRRYPVIASHPSELTTDWVENLIERTIKVSDALIVMLDEKNRQAFSDTLQATQEATARGVGGTERLGGMIDDFDTGVRDMHAQADALTVRLTDLSASLATIETGIDDASAIVRKVNSWARDFDVQVQGIRPEQTDLTQNTLRELTGSIAEARAVVRHFARVVDDFARDPSHTFSGKPAGTYKPK